MRINLNPVICGRIYEFLDFVKTFANQYLIIHFHPIADMGGDIVPSLICDQDFFVNTLPDLNKYCQENNLNTDIMHDMLCPFSGTCYAGNSKSFVIDRLGLIRKCTVDYNGVENIVGYIKDSNAIRFSQESNDLWCENYSLKNPICKDCEKLPVCYGAGCPLKAMVYFYCIYGFCVKSNIELTLLEKIEEPTTYDIELLVSYSNLPYSNNIDINRICNGYRIILCDYAHYFIYENQNVIKCTSRGFEEFFSTLFNIPFSIYLLLRGEMLFHCCSMLYGKKLICFAGEKGIGKSTLTKMLNGDTLKQYSDDTLRISTDHTAYRAHNLIKYTAETINYLEPSYITDAHNILGKSYAYISQKSIDVSISFVVLLRRQESVHSKLISVADLVKTTILFNNIVGIKHFDHFLSKIALDYVKSNRFNCAELFIPNSLPKLKQSRQSIIDNIRNNC